MNAVYMFHSSTLGFKHLGAEVTGEPAASWDPTETYQGLVVIKVMLLQLLQQLVAQATWFTDEEGASGVVERQVVFQLGE